MIAVIRVRRLYRVETSALILTDELKPSDTTMATEPRIRAMTRFEPSHQEGATDGEKRASVAMDRICEHGDDAGARALVPRRPDDLQSDPHV